MKRTTRKFALTAACCLAAQGLAFSACAFGIHPEVICDRHPPGHYGPLQVMFDYSDSIGMVIDPKYVNNIGPYDALALELAFGAAEFRGALTWGHALAYDHFIKLTAEYFAQEAPFSFASGRDTKWIGQKGLGLDYSYRPDHWCGIWDIHLSGEMNRSESESMKERLTDEAIPRINVRRVAGTDNYGATLGVTLLPWMGATVRIDAHHDSVKFKTKHNHNKTLAGIGASVYYTQKVSDRTTLMVFGSDRQAYYQYGLWCGSLLKTDPATKIEVFFRYRLSGGPGVPEKNENRYALGINYSWGGDKYAQAPKYFEPIRSDITSELVEYTNVAAVRPPQVIAKEDQLVLTTPP